MSRYNLIDEKWIPVRLLDGTRNELGICDTLLRSKEIAAIEDPSPLVVAALHRFLLAVLYRALEGPTDIDEAKKLFKEGLPHKEITAYLEKWRDRFWLFDGKYPFFQVPDYEPKEKNGIKQWRAWTAIAAEHNADNAKVLFDHSDVTAADDVRASMAVRWLLATQTFALGGGNSDFQYTKSALSAPAAMVLPIGPNLSDTLLLCLVPENKQILQNDLPIWEREPVLSAAMKSGVARPVMGVVDLYTWQTRSIKFHLDGDGEMLSALAFASGIECRSEDFVDPMLGYWISEKNGKQAIRFNDRGIWRDFDSLLPDASHFAPRIVEHAKVLSRSDSGHFPRSIIVLGQANDQAKIEYWRMERFMLPEALGSDRDIRAEIRQLLLDADKTGNVLERTMKSAAKLTIARGDRELQEDKWRNRKWMPGDISKFIGKSTPEGVPIALASYWSTLESWFHEILREYTVDSDSDDIRCLWLKHVRDALNRAWEQHRAASISVGNAWAIRALVKAEGQVQHKLKELNEEIMKYELQEEGA